MRNRLLCFVALVVAAAPLALSGSGARAEPVDTTSTTVTPDTTTTSTTTTTPASPTTTAVTRPTTTVPAPDGLPPSDPPSTPLVVGGDEPLDDSFVLPPELQAKVNAVRRSAPGNNARLLAVVQAYAATAGLTVDQAMVLGLGHFPVAGPTRWVHDWLHPRRGPPVHLHQGIDMWAAEGTPVRAPFAGRLRHENGGLGGLAVYVTAADGTFYYLAHLASTAPGHTSGVTVAQGEIIGTVGDSGNARGGPAHLHFEIHPRGGAAVDPKPIIDRWVNEAIDYAFALAANPTATTAPTAPDPYLVTPPAIRRATTRTVARTARSVPTADAEAGGAGSILVVASLIALCGGRVLRRARAGMTPER
jgi:hypothetical protein